MRDDGPGRPYHVGRHRADRCVRRARPDRGGRSRLRQWREEGIVVPDRAARRLRPSRSGDACRAQRQWLGPRRHQALHLGGHVVGLVSDSGAHGGQAARALRHPQGRPRHLVWQTGIQDGGARQPDRRRHPGRLFRPRQPRRRRHHARLPQHHGVVGYVAAVGRRARVGHRARRARRGRLLHQTTRAIRSAPGAFPDGTRHDRRHDPQGRSGARHALSRRRHDGAPSPPAPAALPRWPSSSAPMPPCR